MKQKPKRSGNYLKRRNDELDRQVLELLKANSLRKVARLVGLSRPTVTLIRDEALRSRREPETVGEIISHVKRESA